METAIDVCVVVLVAGAVGFLVLGAWERRLRPLLVAVRGASSGGARGVARAGVKRLARANRRFVSTRVSQLLQLRIRQAGDAVELTPLELVALSELGALGGLAFGAFVVRATGAGGLWLVLATTLVGGAMPWLRIDEQVKRRHLAISRALPFAMDLLTLAVEAGLDFVGALTKVVEKGRAGPLRDELEFTMKLLKMGRTREEALRTLAERVRIPAVGRFVTAIIQADRMGTGLAKTLRIQAEQLRIERTNRAEKLANQAPVKLLFPLVVFIFPNVFAVLFGPIVFALLRL